MKTFLIGVFLAFIVLVPGVLGQQTIEYKLKLNNTANYVYVPDLGEMASSGLGALTALSDPAHFYVASYLAGFMQGLAAKEGNLVYYGGDSASHTIGIQQDLSNSRVFLTSTQGNWQNIDSRISIIEAGKFLLGLSPTFGFSNTGLLYPVTIILRYPGIDLTGDLSGKGAMSISIENRGVSGGNLTINIEEA